MHRANSKIGESRKRMWGEFFEEHLILNKKMYGLLDKLQVTTDFFYAPASSKYHSSYPGGLSDHSLFVAEVLVDLTDKKVCVWDREESPYLIGLLHDLTKCGCYSTKWDSSPLGGIDKIWYEPNPYYQRLDPIHGADSVAKANGFFDLTEEEEACIRWHMGAYEKENWNGYDEAIRQFRNILWTHTADMYASKILETQTIDH